MVEAFFPVRWFQSGETWVLAYTIREAALTAKSQTKRDAEMRQLNIDLLRGLTRAEWRKLQSTGTLNWDEMSPAVQRACRSMAEEFQYDPGRNILNAFVPSASRDGGFFMKLNSNNTDAVLSIGHPGNNFGVGLPFLMSGKFIYGVAPPL
jgi:hypothetical protein